MNKIKNREKKYLILSVGAAILILCFYAVQLVVPVISDETTTMANAAYLSGYDWSWMIAALGGFYYRYVQALMTLPFLECLQDPYLIYRLSLVLQAIIQGSVIIVVYIICRKHLKIQSLFISLLLALTACFVPSLVLYTFYYRGDFLLGVLPWYVLLFFLESIQNAEEGKRFLRILNTILAVLFCILSYAAHTRGIVVIIALVLAALLLKIFNKRNSLHWLSLGITCLLLLILDWFVGENLKNALYSIGGANVNTIESTNMSVFFDFFSYNAIKDLVMICLSWLQTLIASTQGLVLIGIVSIFSAILKSQIFKTITISVKEKALLLFAFLIFAGYYSVGALFFRGSYLNFATGNAERRIDRLLYDRYAICGAGMIIFIAVYTLCYKKQWLCLKEKIACLILSIATLGIWLWKIFPLAIKYPGYIYNTIILNTFNEVNDPAKILSGEYYTKEALLGISILGVGLMLSILLLSLKNNKRSVYFILLLVLVSDLALIHVNYIKIRKSSNDYVVESTEEVVDFMQGFEDEITDTFPYVLKGSLSGVKIQFYQSQLMNYKMFGKRQEEQLDQNNYFIISAHDDIDLTWYENDYYLFEDFDYENAEYDIVYVKGEDLMRELESLGYEMLEYIPQQIQQ